MRTRVKSGVRGHHQKTTIKQSFWYMRDNRYFVRLFQYMPDSTGPILTAILYFNTSQPRLFDVFHLLFFPCYNRLFFLARYSGRNKARPDHVLKSTMSRTRIKSGVPGHPQKTAIILWTGEKSKPSKGANTFFFMSKKQRNRKITRKARYSFKKNFLFDFCLFEKTA